MLCDSLGALLSAVALAAVYACRLRAPVLPPQEQGTTIFSSHPASFSGTHPFANNQWRHLGDLALEGALVCWHLPHRLLVPLLRLVHAPPRLVVHALPPATRSAVQNPSRTRKQAPGCASPCSRLAAPRRWQQQAVLCSGARDPMPRAHARPKPAARSGPQHWQRTAAALTPRGGCSRVVIGISIVISGCLFSAP